MMGLMSFTGPQRQLVLDSSAALGMTTPLDWALMLQHRHRAVVEPTTATEHRNAETEN
jgi:hypothetical protein